MGAFFGPGPSERRRGGGGGSGRSGFRVRRGDVRIAILDVLSEAQELQDPLNGYQVIGRIGERSEDRWRPSPGSVYPTIAQLQDEGLVESDDERGRRALRLTAAGRAYVADHADELAAVWSPFTRAADREESEGLPDVRGEIAQVMGAVWQIVSTGSPAQRDAAVEILIDTRRRLYGVLADGPDGPAAGSTDRSTDRSANQGEDHPRGS